MIDDGTIVKKSYELYRKYGIKSVSVDEIVAELGISKKTLYCHFRSKDDLLEHVIEYGKRTFFVGIQSAIQHERGVFRKLVLFYVYILKNISDLNPSFMIDLRKINAEQYQCFLQLRDDNLYKRASDIIQQGISEGLFRDDVNDKYLFLNQVYKVLSVADKSIPQMSTKISEATILKLILNDIRGMTTIKGHKKLDKEYDHLLQLT